MSKKGEQYGPGWAYVALMVHENGEIHAVGGDTRGDDPDADLLLIGLERLDVMLTATTADRNDAARYRWLTADLAGDERKARNALLERIAVMSYSAACGAIDAAMSSMQSEEK